MDTTERVQIRFHKDGWWRATKASQRFEARRSIRNLLEELALAGVREASLEWQELPPTGSFGDCCSEAPAALQPFDDVAVSRARLETLRVIHEQLRQAYESLHLAALAADSEEGTTPEALTAAIDELRGLGQKARWAAANAVQAVEHDINMRSLKRVK